MVLTTRASAMFPRKASLAVEGRKGHCCYPNVGSSARTITRVVAITGTVVRTSLRAGKSLVFYTGIYRRKLKSLENIGCLFKCSGGTSRRYPRMSTFISVSGRCANKIVCATAKDRHCRIAFAKENNRDFRGFNVPGPVRTVKQTVTRVTRFRIPSRPGAAFGMNIVRKKASMGAVSNSTSVLMSLHSSDRRRLGQLSGRLRGIVGRTIRRRGTE